MRMTGKVATWLELAAAPHRPGKYVSLRVHPLVRDAFDAPPECNKKCCYAISIDGRWLHAGDGRLTVLKGMEAVDRFMGLVKVSAYDAGEPAHIEVDCGKTSYCMAAGHKAGLHGFA